MHDTMTEYDMLVNNPKSEPSNWTLNYVFVVVMMCYLCNRMRPDFQFYMS